MDRRIPPESPPVPVRNDTLDVKVKQGMQREAFDVALQRADHRRTMDARDRVVTAGVKQTHATPVPDRPVHPIGASQPQQSALFNLKSLQLTELFDLAHAVPNVEAGYAELKPNESISERTAQGFASGSRKLLSDESLALLLNKVQTSHYQMGDSVVLDIVDDPNGVAQISLTWGQSNNWSVGLFLSPQAKRGGADELELSKSLLSQLRQSGISVDAVSVENNSAALPVAVSADG